MHRLDHRVQRLIDALDDHAVLALVPGGIGAGGQLAFHRPLGQHAGIVHQALDGVDHHAEGRQELIGFAALADLLQPFAIAEVAAADVGADSPGIADPVLHQVDGAGHFRIDALVAALDLLAQVVDGHGLQHPVGLHQALQAVNAGVQAVFQVAVLALQVLADLRRDFAPAEPVQAVRHHVHRLQDRVQSLVDALDNLAEVAWMLGGVGPDRKFAFHRRLAEPAGFSHQGLHGQALGRQALERGQQATALARRQVPGRGGVPRRDPVGERAEQGRLGPQFPPQLPGHHHPDADREDQGNQKPGRGQGPEGAGGGACPQEAEHCGEAKAEA